MSMLRDKLEQLLPQWRAERSALLAEHSELEIDLVPLLALYGGMRNVHALVCDTSSVDPQRGLIIRGRPVLELVGRLPEEVFWLLLTGELPDADELLSLQASLRQRQQLPPHIEPLLDVLAEGGHPMTLFNAAVLALQPGSRHSGSYQQQQQRDKLWHSALEDALDLLAIAPLLAALAYHRRYGSMLGEYDPQADMATRYVQQMGLRGGAEAVEMMRLFLLLHSDHENGNVSALACHTVGSTLADPYYAVCSGLNGLAGPIHGLASQMSVEFLREMSQAVEGRDDEDGARNFCLKWIAAGRVVPGYGHAVLRVLDPRFDALHRFGLQHFPDDELLQSADLLYRVAPEILRQQGRIKSPWPNVDGITGAVLHHYGIAQPEYYTVVFGLGLMIGMLAQYVLSRALLAPLVRPRSVTTASLRAMQG